MLPENHEDAPQLGEDLVRQFAEHLRVDVEGSNHLEAKRAVLRYIGCVLPAR